MRGREEFPCGRVVPVKAVSHPRFPDPPGKVQPDGRVVIGPDMSDWSKKKTGDGRPTAAIVVLCVGWLMFLAGWVFGGVAAPDVERVPFPDRVVGQRIQVAEACGGDITRYDNAVIPIGKPLKPGDATLIKQQLETMGYQNVTVEGVTYGGDYYYYAQGCLR